MVSKLKNFNNLFSKEVAIRRSYKRLKEILWHSTKILAFTILKKKKIFEEVQRVYYRMPAFNRDCSLAR